MQHLNGPPNPLFPSEEAKRRCFTGLQTALLIPTHTEITSKRRTAFTFMYSAVTTFPIVVTIASWSFLHPSNVSLPSVSWSRPLLLFLVINVNIVNSIIALIEAVILSSVQKQKVLVLRCVEIPLTCVAASYTLLNHCSVLGLLFLGRGWSNYHRALRFHLL